MKSRMTLIFTALVVILATMIWMVQDRSTVTAAPAMTALAPVIQVEAPVVERVVVAPTTAPATTAPSVAMTTIEKSTPTVRVGVDGNLKYIARGGDTVSQLAIALLGSDTKEHRDAVIAANPSLQADPDRVLSYQTYTVPTEATSTEEDAIAETPAITEKAEPAGPQLKYTARAGESVSTLAANLLGANTKANRDLIIDGNASLQRDPNRLVAGQSYTIDASNGLASDPNAKLAARPTTQPDADEIAQLTVGRTLRYTAVHGDTVSKLATALLGSDSAANRQQIIKSNPSLMHDPDHLVAGQTYWIAAPTADAMR